MYRKNSSVSTLASGFYIDHVLFIGLIVSPLALASEVMLLTVVMQIFDLQKQRSMRLRRKRVDDTETNPRKKI